MDLSEYGAKMADFHHGLAIKRALDAARAEPENESGLWCEDCGNEIPQKRRELVPGVTRCVKCQTAFEKGG